MAQESELKDFAGAETPGAGTDTFSWVYNFAKSGLQSIPEMVGITPSTDTLAWRQDNPVSAFVADMAGMAVPYTGWFKATQMLGRFDKAVNALGVATKPFAQGALQQAARFAPFEAGRLGVSQVVGDKPFTEMLGDTTFNLAAGAGIGGLLHGFAAAGVRDPKLSTIFPGLDLAAPLPLQARQMKDIINSGTLTGEVLDKAKFTLNNTLRDAKIEELKLGEKYIGPIDPAFVAGSKPGDLEHQLNRLFRPTDNDPSRLVQINRFAVGAERDFKTPVDMNQAMLTSGLGEGFETSGQYFRHVTFTQDTAKALAAAKTAQGIDNRITKNMQSVGAGAFMTREADDGMFIIARKTEGTPGAGSASDKWTIFKTDQPGTFVPDADRWAKTIIAQSKWQPAADLAADGGEVYNSTRNWTQNFPLRNYMGMAKTPSKVGETVSKLMPDVVGKDNELVQRLGEVFREYLMPRIHQFKNNWRANYLVNALKVSYDSAENMVSQVLNGTTKLDPGKQLFMLSLRNDKTGVAGMKPVRDLVEPMLEKDFQEQFSRLIWREGVPAADLDALQTAGKITPEIGNFAKSLDAIDKYVIDQIRKAEIAVGKKPTEWREGHYGLGRFWEGDTRIVIENDAGEVVGLGGGPNRRMAKADAQKLVAENPGWRISGEHSLSASDIPANLIPQVRSPSFLLERQDMRGFKFDTTAFTKKEFLEHYENSLRARMKYMANISTDDILGASMHRLAQEDAQAFRMVQARLNDYAGVPSAFSKAQNRVADQVLGPILGPNSATNLVQLTSTALFNFQLGAMKLSYPIVNALQFVQTVIPEAAFVMGSAPPARIAPGYSFFAAGGTKGPVGGVAVLSPLKLMWNSVREMRSPSPELTTAMERAINDRVIDPRNVENYMGASAAKVSNLRGLLKGEVGVVDWLRALSEFLPANSEQLSRTHAFTVGHMIARDFLRTREGLPLNPNEIYSVAKQFTENTMYLYSAADKPRIFTTPAGSMMGLFKNWMMHYIGSMGEYSKEAFMHGNFAPLAWQTAGTFTLGGLAATPIWWTADAFSRAWANKSALQMAYEQWGDKADGVMLGLPAALTGVSLYSSVNTPLANPTRDAAQLFSVVAWDRARQIGKFAGAAFDNWQTTGEHPAHNQGVRELLVKAFAPTTIYRSMAAMEPGQITQLGTDKPLVKDVSNAHRILYGFGFNPVEVDRGQAVSQELYAKHEILKAQVKKLGSAWYDASSRGDGAQMAVIMRQGLVWGVDLSQVIKEGMFQMRQHQQDIIERNLRPRDIGPYRSVISVQRGVSE